MNFLNKYSVLNYIFCFIPFAFALGNSAINLNIFLIIIIGFFLFKQKLIFIDKNPINISLILFFFITIISSFLNYFDLQRFSFIDAESKKNFFKSILYFRFFLVFVVLVELIKIEKFNIAYFYVSAAIVSFFLCIDIIYQAYFSVDLFGYVVNPSSHRLSGFFGDEYIAGGYLQKFSLFLIFFFPFIKIKTNYLKILYFFFFLFICFITLVLTNNRMPMVLFCLSFFFLSFFFNKLKKITIVAAITMLIILSLFIKFNERTYNFLNNYIFQIKQISQVFIERDKIKEGQILIKSDYARLFNSSLDLSNKNKIFGLGIKSFRKNCFNNLTINNLNKSCNNHPHNYYFEIIISTGYVGLIIFVYILFISIKNFLKNYKKYNYYNLNNKLIITIPFVIFLVEMFPIRSSGGFFTTYNSAYIFILIAIVNYLAINNIKNLKN